MKLFAFKPNGHGQLSLFVMAETEDKAREYADAHVNQTGQDSYGFQGWGTDYYTVEVAEEEQVIDNSND